MIARSDEQAARCGSGKSSLVRAGLLPALREGFLFGAPEWVIPIIKPGNAPYQRLATALCQPEDMLRRAMSGGAEMDKKAFSVHEALTLATLQKSERGLIDALHDAGLPQDCHVMIVVDQFEEIFAFRRATVAAADRQEVASRDEAAAFVNMLLRSCADPKNRIWVVLTMRSDFIGNCEAFLGLPEIVSRSQFLLPRLDPKQMEEAIVRPGEVKTAAFQPFTFQQDLVNRIINDAGDRPDQLPMMQHALMRTWKRAVERNSNGGKLVLSHEDYENAGQIEEALFPIAGSAENHSSDLRKTHHRLSKASTQATSPQSPGINACRRTVDLPQLTPKRENCTAPTSSGRAAIPRGDWRTPPAQRSRPDYSMAERQPTICAMGPTVRDIG